ncbi:type VI secretion system baseplate subunit TssF [Aporhodopirellula aestuarii]|uniref:Type VI secretion system baseplate subunit TssF n=1 Tax=Aporhodopirellula aestuarii TaxID=2950107 RepID=A0ABT0TZ76_9BACT|nr:type VI secretion system baseplate subunit TssF [Aporhodopirellula aestuarii]MCM2369875.1 type VI secretion system baseplate subunit TssF [Aporhodopirellula aestuarii]
MDTRLLSYYEQELQYIRESGGEFAQQYPKIAGRLGLETLACADPYVERLLEGFAFLAARIQLKMDSEVPRFTQHLLELVYPHYLYPTPSATIAQFNPDLTEGRLNEGHHVPRGVRLRTAPAEDSQIQCQYTTTQGVDLWPLEVIDCTYFSRDVTTLSLPSRLRDIASAGLRIRLRATAGLKISELQLKELPLYLVGPDETPVRLYEQLMATTVAVVVQPVGANPAWQVVLGKESVSPVGFENDQASIPFDNRSFQGYRLLREYFAFPEKFLFAKLSQLDQAIRRCDDEEIEIIVVFDRADPILQRSVNKQSVQLHCTPAINLFPQRADSIHLSDSHFEHHVVPDRSRPLDLEVFDVKSVIGRGVDMEHDQVFEPFYSMTDGLGGDAMAYYTINRVPRVASSKQKLEGARSSYTGSEVYLSLVDGRAAPYRRELQMLSVEVLCTNRDLPLQIPIGALETDFTLDIGAPVESIRCIAGPTAPRPSLAHARGELLWRIVSHLSLNYLSLCDSDSKSGAAAIRQLLELYSPTDGSTIEKQINGIQSIRSKGITRQLPTTGPITFGRGVEVELEFDESAFKGQGGFLLGSVLEQFFSKYVSLNSFTETVLRTQQRGEIKRWPARMGRRPLL